LDLHGNTDIKNTANYVDSLPLKNNLKKYHDKNECQHKHEMDITIVGLVNAGR
jgi:hypothetical protein